MAGTARSTKPAKPGTLGAWLRALAQPPVIHRIEVLAVGEVWGERFHTTTSHELVHVLQGHATIEYKSRSFRVGPGGTFVIPQGTPHRDIRAPGPDYKVVYVFLAWDAGAPLLRKLDNAGLQRMHAGAKQHLHALTKELEQEYLGEAPGAPERMQLLTSELLLALARSADRFERKPRHENARMRAAVARRGQLMAEVRNFLEAHHAEELGLEALAERFGLSPFNLSRSFTQTFGRSLVETLAAIRVERARDLLAQGLSVKEAAARVGYANGNYFAKVFRRLTGRSPSEFLAAAMRARR